MKKAREDALKEHGLEDVAKVKRGIMATAGRQGIPPDTMVDLALGMMETTKEGSEKSGYRVLMRGVGSDSKSDMRWFVRREEGEYRVFAVSPRLERPW